MLVLHANWSSGRLHLWAESSEAFAAGDGGFALGHDQFAEALGALVGVPRDLLAGAAQSAIDLVVPATERGPEPSARLAAGMGYESAEASTLTLDSVRIDTLAFGSIEALAVLDAIEDRDERADITGSRSWTLDATLEYAAAVARFARHLMAHQRFVPMLMQEPGGELQAAWRPWLGDKATASGVALLFKAMPPSFRAADDELAHHTWAVLESMLASLTDAAGRRALLDDDMNETVEDRDPADPQVAWAQGLLLEADRVPPSEASRTDVVKTVRRWIGSLEERGASADWRLLLRLNEPVDSALVEDLAAPPASVLWSISFHLQSVDAPEIVLDATDIWALPGETVTIEGLRADNPTELLLGELGRAARLYKPLDEALSESEPIELSLATNKAYQFLREVRPILIEQGVGVEVPDWWESPSARLGTRLRLGEPGDELDPDARSGGSTASSPELGLDTLIDYRWEIAVGDVTLTLHEFEQLAEKDTPLIRVNGKWVEIRPEDVKAAIGFIGENPGGQMSVGEAMRMAYASDLRETGVPVLGLDAGGWLGAMLGGDNKELPQVETPAGFHGTLRPYQQRGLSWMAFLESIGFGVCLADDMGLGKTIQLLALMVHEREKREELVAKGAEVEVVGPTLLVVPMSVVGNWMYESRRFAPSLKVYVHHGVERLAGVELAQKCQNSDMVITTYALANRDQDDLGLVTWRRVVLDEAQYVKNPQAKQSQAVRSFSTQRRIALTGTPVENRLTELWSIMDFLNPSYLGPSSGFRKRFSVPIERYRDQNRAEQLRSLVRPFILRRLKTDPDVVSDLPEKLESKEFCHLTSEQASLYEATVNRMLNDVADAAGIQRRGLVLSTLIKLKQICNHPSQMLKDHDFSASKPPDPRRSGKCIRILEMMEEVLAEQHQALIFTQFRQMGHLLSIMLKQHFGRDVLFLHGGSTQAKREQMIADFQTADGRYPILLLSLKAGGVGLNLTAASHVFHFDRWWNPAVEDQATDRAYRIGQTKTVQVHKYVVRGTLEERIDEMIERKTELARNIIGSGERWLTELDTDQLREILTLRHDAVGDEED